MMTETVFCSIHDTHVVDLALADVIQTRQTPCGSDHRVAQY